MTDKRTQDPARQGNMEKDPDDWVTGDEPMTGAQRSYLKTLSEEARQPFDETLSKAQASRRIEELQALTGRGDPGPGPEGSQAQRPPDTKGVMESLGEAISAPVLGVDDGDAGDARVAARRENERKGGHSGR
jgi:hypothetical protein